MEKQSREIIILGAGLAGLTLAYRLKKQGIKVLILEARDRIGGRIHTIEHDQTTLELGATWFADKHVNLLGLLNEFDLRKIDQEYGKYGIYELADGQKQLFELPAQPEATYRIEGGTEKLIDALRNELDDDQIILNQPVEKVIEQEQSLEILTKSEVFESKFLVSTLPPNLMVSRIEFEPKLPAEFISFSKQTHTWMGESIKVGFFSPTPFWLEKGIGTVYSQKGPITEFYDHSNAHGYALKGFIHDGFIALPKTEREKAVRAQLTNLFGEENISNGIYVETPWKEEKETYADYPKFVVPHQNNGRSEFREALLNDKLFLAGSETAPTFPGYMDGAVEAATLTSQKILLMMSSQFQA